ncbi:hypothetical protein [Cohnella sp. GCM10012308]|uniref:hypothetical protein n=1 Tax=Cohnella sp. GCM10012308 TaxID=3317329 RepID=UPI0036108253
MSRKEIELSAKDKMRISGMIADISGLASMINLHTEFCVFCNISAHVSKVEVDIRRSKEDYKDRLVSARISYDPEMFGDSEEIIAQFGKVKYQLKKILREQKIDYSSLPYEIEEVRHYKLV